MPTDITKFWENANDIYRRWIEANYGNREKITMTLKEAIETKQPISRRGGLAIIYPKMVYKTATGNLYEFSIDDILSSDWLTEEQINKNVQDALIQEMRDV